MMNLLKLLILILTLFLLVSNKVYAHVLESDGSIGAVMHVTPDDDPIAREESGFYFEFKDKTSKFKPENCICTFSIEKNGEQIFTQNLFANNSDPSLSNASINFTFPEKNIYKIVITGQPKISGDFEAFALEYDLRVERESEKIAAQAAPPVPQQNKQLPVAPIIIGIAGLGVGVYFFLNKKKK